MSEAQSRSGRGATERAQWQTPRLARLEADAAQAAFVGVGADAGIYS